MCALFLCSTCYYACECVSLSVCVCICCRQRRQTSRNAKRRGRARSRQQIDDSDVDCGARLALQESSTRHDSTRHDAVTPAATIVVNCAKSSTGCHIAHTRSQHVDNLPAYSARSLALSLSLLLSQRESERVMSAVRSNCCRPS